MHVCTALHLTNIFVLVVQTVVVAWSFQWGRPGLEQGDGPSMLVDTLGGN